MGIEPISDNNNNRANVSVINNKESNTKPVQNDKHIHELAFYRGYRDFVHGKLDSPYRRDSLLSKEWQRGQNAAYFKNLELLKSGRLFKKFKQKKDMAKLNKKVKVTVH